MLSKDYLIGYIKSLQDMRDIYIKQLDNISTAIQLQIEKLDDLKSEKKENN